MGSQAGEETQSPSIAPGVDEISVCDCSFCVKRLIIWTRQPEDRVKLRKGCEEGKGSVGVYRFGEKDLSHHFCSTCGTYLYASKASDVGYLYLNLRALREPVFSVYDLPASRIKQLHSCQLQPAYQEPSLPGDVAERISSLQSELKDSEGETVVHTGACHCQDVVFGYIGKDIRKEDVGACLCSICYGNGNVWIGDPQNRIFFAPPSPASPHRPPPQRVTRYSFGDAPHSINEHIFCKRCGCQVMEIKENNQTDRRTLGVNVACFNNAYGPEEGGKGYLSDALGRVLVKVNAKPREWEPKYQLTF